MTGGHYDFMVSTTLAVIATVVIFIIAELIPSEPVPNHDHH